MSHPEVVSQALVVTVRCVTSLQRLPLTFTAAANRLNRTEGSPRRRCPVLSN